MSILRYAPGEYYRPHVDYFNPRLDVSKDFLQDGGQRTASAVTYLTAPTAGGGTSFPKLKVTVPPVAGGTLWFRNCLENGQIDERSLHAGDTVIDGEKWVVTKWFREKPTQYLQI
jgi:prolyl 4-hydroxylase